MTPGNQNRWEIFKQQPSICSKISAELNIHPIIAQVLLNRKMSSLSEASQFLCPDTTKTIPNFNPEILQKTAEILDHHIKQKNSIFIYGDYDVDGITSTTILYAVLKQCGANVSYHIPHRFTDGYGLNASVIESLANKNTKLLITTDCGISNNREISALKKNTNIDVIILDHHTLPDSLPPADAIINPKTLNQTHPLYHLCAAGVVYKVMEYFCETLKKPVDITNYLDLVALGTIADVVPLVAENRRLTKLGIRHLSKQTRPGIRQLLQAANFNKPEVSPRDVGFIIAPRLNAAGRLKHAKICVELLSTTSASDAEKISIKLQSLNEKRQHIDANILNETTKLLTQSNYSEKHNILALAGSHWHAGVIGITASRLSSKFMRPTVLIAYDDKIGRGSARSYGTVNIYEILKELDDFYVSFGGHKEAAGFSIKPEKIDAFQSALIAHANKTINQQTLSPILDIDATIDPQEINIELAKQLEQLEPFGAANPSPIFFTDKLTPIEFKTVGNGSHLKATFSDASGKIIVDGIGFGLSEKLPILYNKNIELAFHIEINHWQNQERVQLNLIDIK